MSQSTRLTHIDLSVPPGAVENAAEDLDRLLTATLGWAGVTSIAEHPSLGRTTTRTYTVGGGDIRLVLREAEDPMHGGVEDHLGFVVTPDEIARLGRACRAVEGIETKYLEDGVPSRIDTGASIFRTFFVRHPLLPLWFQFESYEPS